MSKRKTKQDLKTATTEAVNEDKQIIEAFASAIEEVFSGGMTANASITEGLETDILSICPYDSIRSKLIYAAAMDAGFEANLEDGGRLVRINCTDDMVEAAVDESSKTMTAFSRILKNKIRMEELTQGFIGTNKGEIVRNSGLIYDYAKDATIQATAERVNHDFGVINAFTECREHAHTIVETMKSLKASYVKPNPGSLQTIAEGLSAERGIGTEIKVFKKCLTENAAFTPALEAIFPDTAVKVGQAKSVKTPANAVRQ